jgi:hypothetical protein
MKTGLLLLAYLSLLDVLSTAAGLGQGASEANVLPAYVLATWGMGAMFGAKGVVTAGMIGAVWALHGRYPRLRYGVAACNVILGAVVALNVWQLGL